ncbi:unnamed protein product [Acanthoscelides obtectus]|uniref:Uncharacterized protein n=1 Tax=Acanthoscelides obtectus TaxID=200917 RepID=A0A9P0MFE0_ACAOB|nr:unnamed protein product [Acanthoscelides obtectus]CAK1629593.1 hypothetical protein AOBTE_LOCUS5838 [Acanthoscelides obtectus]
MKFYEIFAAKFQAKASKTNIEDDCRLIPADRTSIESILEMMKRLITVECWQFSIVQMKPESWSDLISLHLIQLILAVTVEVF